MQKIDFKDPKDAMVVVREFNLNVKRTIEQKLAALVKDAGGCIRFNEDPYLGYPRVYSDDSRCSIPELKRIYVNKDGRIQFTTDKYTRIAFPHCESISIGELLQVWDIATQRQ